MKGAEAMRFTCECGKVLNADECGFRNENYKEILVYVCPYCAVKTTAFVRLTPEKPGSVREIMPGLEFTPERLEPSLEERVKQFFYKTTQRNDAALSLENPSTLMPSDWTYVKKSLDRNGGKSSLSREIIFKH